MEKFRQKLHIEPPEGWLNDPNGLSFFKDEYHVFFQYSPGSPEGRTPRCWGHCKGRELFSMSYEGIAVSPEIPEERNGVYSGSAVENGGILHIFYTGNVKEKGDFNYVTNGRGANVIRISTADGVHFGEKQVLLRNPDYPDFCSCHVRDPKVWIENGVWKMVLGARTADDHGCVLVYTSGDGENWSYVTCVSKPDFEYMWECPDYFSIGGKGYLSVSPQGLPHFDTKFQNVFQSGYFTLSGTLEDNAPEEFYEWDMGFDFYAPQTFEAPGGRRVLIGWMGMDNQADYGNATTALGWQHCLTLPREITVLENGRLAQNPVAELNGLFGEKKSLSDGETSEVKLPFDFSARADGKFTAELDGRLRLEYVPSEKIFRLVFADKLYGCGRTERKAVIGKLEDIRIIADMSSLEIYLNGGETVFGTRFYPDGESVRLTVSGSVSAALRNFLKED